MPITWGSGGGGGSGSGLTPATTPTIVNLTVAVANVEQSYAFPAATKQFLVKHRSGGKVTYAYAAGTSGTAFLTLDKGSNFSVSDIAVNSLTLYFQSPTAGTIIEVSSWA